jgi:putative peptidoglycan lipid II flippase
VRILTTTFYAMQDTKTPVKIAMIGVASNIILSAALMVPLRHSGLALANSLASGINFFLLSLFLRKKLRRIDAKKIIKSFFQISLASFAMGIAGWAVLHGELWTKSGATVIKAMYLSGTMILCIIIYIAATTIMKNDEMQYVREMIMKKLGKG